MNLSGRLHPMSWLFSLTDLLRSLIAPAIALLVFGQGDGYELWFGLFAIPIVIWSVIHALSFRYGFTSEGLEVRSGVLFRSVRRIPLARVQNVNRVQGLLHRLLGLVELRLESAGGTGTEARLRVLDRRSADAFEVSLRLQAGHSAAQGTDTAATDAAAGELLLELSTAELVRAGLISNRGMLVAAAAGGVFSQFAPDMGDPGHAGKVLYNLAHDYVIASGLPQLGVLGWLLAGTIGFALLAGLLRLLSVALAIARYHGFRLTLEGQRVVAEYGLFTRVRAVTAVEKIQLVRIHETLLHRLFDRVSVEIEIAGIKSGDGSSQKISLAVLMPIARPEQAMEVLKRLMPEQDWEPQIWARLDPRADRILFRRSVIGLSLGILAASLLVGPWALLGLALLPWMRLSARRWAEYSGYVDEGPAFAFRSGWPGHVRSHLRTPKAQVLELAHSPFDRRRGTATLRVDSAGGHSGSERLTIPLLPDAIARTLLARWSARVARLRY